MNCCAECSTFFQSQRELYAHMLEEHGDCLLLVDLENYPKAVVNLRISADKIAAMRTMATLAANAMGLRANHIAYEMGPEEVQIVYCGDTIKLQAEVWERFQILPVSYRMKAETGVRSLVYATPEGFTVHFLDMPEGVRVVQLSYDEYLAVTQ